MTIQKPTPAQEEDWDLGPDWIQTVTRGPRLRDSMTEEDWAREKEDASKIFPSLAILAPQTITLPKGTVKHRDAMTDEGWNAVESQTKAVRRPSSEEGRGGEGRNTPHRLELP